jgi:hypothetical protein
MLSSTDAWRELRDEELFQRHPALLTLQWPAKWEAIMIRLTGVPSGPTAYHCWRWIALNAQARYTRLPERNVYDDFYVVEGTTFDWSLVHACKGVAPHDLYTAALVMCFVHGALVVDDRYDMIRVRAFAYFNELTYSDLDALQLLDGVSKIGETLWVEYDTVTELSPVLLLADATPLGCRELQDATTIAIALGATEDRYASRSMCSPVRLEVSDFNELVELLEQPHVLRRNRGCKLALWMVLRRLNYSARYNRLTLLPFHFWLCAYMVPADCTRPIAVSDHVELILHTYVRVLAPSATGEACRVDRVTRHYPARVAFLACVRAHVSVVLVGPLTLSQFHAFASAAVLTTPLPRVAYDYANAWEDAISLVMYRFVENAILNVLGWSSEWSPDNDAYVCTRHLMPFVRSMVVRIMRDTTRGCAFPPAEVHRSALREMINMIKKGKRDPFALRVWATLY